MAVCAISGDDGPCGSCKIIEDIDARILEVEKHLASLKADRVALKIARNASHDRIVARLPLEILSQIFQIYVDAAFNDDESDDGGKVSPFLVRCMEDAPLRLGAVCHTWRTIAWTSPRLWIKISVNVLGKGGEILPELATQWLERTGQRPLTICLYEATYAESVVDTNKEGVISLMRTLCKIASRWQTLSISLHNHQYIDDDNTTRFWTPEIDGQDCNLQHLRLENCSPNFTAQLFKTLHRKPSPTYVSLSRVQIGRLDIDWSNVTTIDVNCLTFQDSIQLFRASVRLQTFNLEMMAFPHPTPRQPLSSPVIIPMLRSLCLSHPSASIVLDCVMLPLLEELQWYSENGTVDSLVSLVGRSQCQLASLQIRNCKITNELLLFLQATASLRSLSIHDDLGDGNAERLFKYLATSDESTDLPYLETLQFTIRPRRIILWKTIPDIFNPGQSYIGHSPAPQGSPHLQRRSLNLLLDITGEVDQIGYIDMMSLYRISELLEQDVSILFRKTFSYNEPEDFIAMSMAFHCPNEETSTGHKGG